MTSTEVDFGADMVPPVPTTKTFEQLVLHPDRATYTQVISALRDRGYITATDLTVVDYLNHPGRSDLPAPVQPERFEVVVSLFDHIRRHRVRIRVQVPAGDPIVASLYDLYPGTEAMEREAWDLFGVVFEGHPDLTRILLPEDWVGHPLRKDEGIGSIPVQFKQAPK